MESAEIPYLSVPTSSPVLDNPGWGIACVLHPAVMKLTGNDREVVIAYVKDLENNEYKTDVKREYLEAVEAVKQTRPHVNVAEQVHLSITETWANKEWGGDRGDTEEVVCRKLEIAKAQLKTWNDRLFAHYDVIMATTAELEKDHSYAAWLLRNLAKTKTADYSSAF